MGHAGWIHNKRSPRITNTFSPICLPFMQSRPYSRVRRARSGKSEVDGSAPPFAAWTGHGGVAQFTFAQHPLGGSVPSKIYLAGRARITPMTGRMGHRRDLKIHEERLEILPTGQTRIIDRTLDIPPEIRLSLPFPPLDPLCSPIR